MRLMVTGGGSGGHVYPALTVAEEWLRRDAGAEVLFVGTARGMEADLVPRAGVPFATVSALGLVGKSPLQAARALLAAGRGTGQAMAHIRRFRPHVVLGTGGYVSGPVLLAAALQGVPTAVWEGNVYPGFANRLISRFARVVFVPHAAARRHLPSRVQALVVGTPLRSQVLDADRAAARQALGLGEDEQLLLVFGGSQGARALSQAVVGDLRHYAARPGLRLLHAAGPAQYEAVAAAYRQAGVDPAGPKLRLVPYVYDMPQALAASDLAVTRAGASTLAELTARGVPAVLIPLPVAHNHQEHNARTLEQEGAALMIRQPELTPARLSQTVFSLLDDRQRLAAMSAAAARLANPHAAAVIVDNLVGLAARTEGR